MDVRKGSWLIILDNADDACFLLESPTPNEEYKAPPLVECLPVCEHGSILITTRSMNAALQLVDRNDVINVHPMEEEQAVALLEKKLVEHADRNDIKDLATVLEFMPLAITQAAAYIHRRGRRSSVQQYLEEFRDSDQSITSLLNYDTRDLRRDRAATNSIILTWQISFTHILNIRRRAANLLSLMSLCDRQAIPEVLLRIQGDKESARDNTFEEDIEILLEFSFISESSNSSAFQMHRLVQLATRKWLESREELDWYVEEFVSKLNLAFPSDVYTNWNLCQTLFPHTISAFSFVPKSRLGVLKWALVLQRGAEYASRKGGARLWTQAIGMGERSWKVRKSKLGEDHPDTLVSMGNLAGYYDSLGDSTKAAEMGEQCWKVGKSTLGEDHPDTLASMSNLAGYHNRLGDSRKAAEMGEQCWKTGKSTLGEDHPNTLVSMSNLADYYDRLGDSGKAAEVGERCWIMMKEKLGEDHPHTLTSMGNLAWYYDSLGGSGKAAEIGEQCWKVRKSILGEDHPDTLVSISNLAEYYDSLGDSRKAVEMGEQCWKVRKSILGEDHPDTLVSMSNLAEYYDSLGDSRKAAEMGEQCWKVRKSILGEDHPDTLTSMSNLAGYYDSLGDSGKAAEVEGQYHGQKQIKPQANQPSLLSLLGDPDRHLTFTHSNAHSARKDHSFTNSQLRSGRAAKSRLSLLRKFRRLRL